MQKISLTLDTCVLNARDTNPEMTRLDQLHRDGRVDIFKTDVMDTELKGPYAEKGGLVKSSSYPEDRGVGVWGHFRWGHGSWGTPEDDRQLGAMLALLFDKKQRSAYSKNQIRDARALLAHQKANRDHFVTIDGGLLRRREDLQRRFGISVCDPRVDFPKIVQGFSSAEGGEE